MILRTEKTERGTSYILDVLAFRHAIKKVRGKSIRFVLPDGVADMIDAPVLRHLLPGVSSVKIELFLDSRSWEARSELIEPLDVGYDARNFWGPTVRGRVRPELYNPPPRIGLLCLGREHEGGRGLVYLYLFPPSDEREVGTCLIA